MTTEDDLTLGFLSAAFPEDDIRLVGARGREAISRLFEIDLLLVLAREDAALTDEAIDALLHAPCAAAFGPGPGDIVHGVLRSVRRIEARAGSAARIVATMVPTVWLLTLARTNRVYQDVTVPALIQAVLARYGLTPGDDFEIRTSSSYSTREYVVQYNETDWDFLQRWLEREGLFYWFEHGGVRDKLIIADSNRDASSMAGPRSLSHRRRNDRSSGDVSTFWGLTEERSRLPARVAVFDYNYRTPHIRIAARAPVDATHGFGTVMNYNEHVKTRAEGDEVARVRAERLRCEAHVFSGFTDCARLRAGHVFDSEGHDDPSSDRTYLVRSVEHRVGLGIPSYGRGPDEDAGAFDPEGQGASRCYGARFTAIPLSVQYRPPRATPWPTIHGVMHAHIDAEGAGELAPIDEAGRYKVRLPFDSGSAKGALASRWIRMAQPSSGVGYGAHMPLHKGAEVLLAHIDGDPDRPLIVGAVPHAHTVSPVTSINSSQSVINTPSGIRIEMEDRQPQ